MIARGRGQAGVRRRHIADRGVIERFALGVPGAEAVDRLDVGLEMRRERDVLRKRAEVVALRQHARRNQRRRQQGLGAPRLAECFERTIEVPEQPERHPVERRLAQSEEVHAWKLVRLGHRRTVAASRLLNTTLRSRRRRLACTRFASA